VWGQVIDESGFPGVFFAVDMKAEAEPVPVENRAEHCIEVREIR